MYQFNHFRTVPADYRQGHLSLIHEDKIFYHALYLTMSSTMQIQFRHLFNLMLCASATRLRKLLELKLWSLPLNTISMPRAEHSLLPVNSLN